LTDAYYATILRWLTRTKYDGTPDPAGFQITNRPGKEPLVQYADNGNAERAELGDRHVWDKDPDVLLARLYEAANGGFIAFADWIQVGTQVGSLSVPDNPVCPGSSHGGGPRPAVSASTGSSPNGI
jgi:hypothetical protein